MIDRRSFLKFTALAPIVGVLGMGVKNLSAAVIPPTTIPISAFDRVNVRILLLEIETALKETLTPFMFQKYNYKTREKVEHKITTMLTNFKVQRRLRYYRVQVDEQNNSNPNELTVDLWIAPSRIIEIVPINVTISNNNNFRELK